MSSSNTFESRESLNDELDSFLDREFSLHGGSHDTDELMDRPVEKDLASAYNSEIDTDIESEDEAGSGAVSLETYLNQWKQQQAIERSLCEDAENLAQTVLGSEYRKVLAKGLGRPDSIVQSWFDRPACMPPQVPLILELLKSCPQEKWPVRWQQTAFGNSDK